MIAFAAFVAGLLLGGVIGITLVCLLVAGRAVR